MWSPEFALVEKRDNYICVYNSRIESEMLHSKGCTGHFKGLFKLNSCYEFLLYFSSAYFLVNYSKSLVVSNFFLCFSYVIYFSSVYFLVNFSCKIRNVYFKTFKGINFNYLNQNSQTYIMQRKDLGFSCYCQFCVNVLFLPCFQIQSKNQPIYIYSFQYSWFPSVL